MDKAIIVKNDMIIKEKEISGYIFILFGFHDFKTVIEKIERKLGH